MGIRPPTQMSQDLKDSTVESSSPEGIVERFPRLAAASYSELLTEHKLTRKPFLLPLGRWMSRATLGEWH